MGPAVRQYMKVVGRRYRVGEVGERNPDRARDLARVSNLDDFLGGGEDERRHCNARSARRGVDIVEPADEETIGEKIDPDLLFRLADRGVERGFPFLSPAARKSHVARPRVAFGSGALDEKDLEIARRGAHDERDRSAGEAWIGIDEPGLPALQRCVERADSQVDHWARERG